MAAAHAFEKHVLKLIKLDVMTVVAGAALKQSFTAAHCTPMAAASRRVRVRTEELSISVDGCIKLESSKRPTIVLAIKSTTSRPKSTMATVLVVRPRDRSDCATDAPIPPAHVKTTIHNVRGRNPNPAPVTMDAATIKLPVMELVNIPKRRT